MRALQIHKSIYQYGTVVCLLEIRDAKLTEVFVIIIIIITIIFNNTYTNSKPHIKAAKGILYI